MLLIRCGWLRLCSDPICSEQHLGLGYCSSSRGTRGILRRAEAPEADSVSSSSLIRPRLRHLIYTKALPPHSWLSGAWAMGSLQLWRISPTVPPVAGRCLQLPQGLPERWWLHSALRGKRSARKSLVWVP